MPMPVLVLLSVPATNERGPLYMEQALAALRQGNPGRLPLSLLFLRHGNAVTLGACNHDRRLRPLDP